MTNNLGTARIADGQASGQWASSNAADGAHDAALTEHLALAFTSTHTLTLTALQFISNYSFTAGNGSPVPTAACTLNVPNVNALGATLKRGSFTVVNDLSFDLTVQVSGQVRTPPTLSPGQGAVLLMNGADVVLAVPQGAIGSNGADGSDPGILYTFDTGTTDADPGAGKLRANNASLASATALYIDDLDRSGNNVEAHLLTWDDSTNTPKGHLYLTRTSDGAQTIFTVGAVTDSAGYIGLAVTYVSGATAFTAADAISAQFYRAGDAGSGSAKIAQVVNTQTGVHATGSTLIPIDNTIPQNTEGTEFMTLAITPTNVSSTLLIEVAAFIHIGSTTDKWITGALFQDSAAGAIAASAHYHSNGGATMVFTHKMTAGTTSATTFKFRAGPHAATTIGFNGTHLGGLLGGVMASSITITEVMP